MLSLASSPSFAGRRRFFEPTLYVFFAAGFFFASGGLLLQIAGLNPREAMQMTSGSPVSQMILSFLYLGAAFLFFRSPQAGPVLARVWPILVLPVLAIISTLWSPDPVLTLRRSIAFFGTVFFGISLATRLSFREGLALIIQVLSLSMVMSLILVVAFPAQGLHQLTDSFPFQPEHAGLWRGIFAHRNILGFFAALAFSLLLIYGDLAFRNRAVRVCALLASIACLIGARSGCGFVIAVALPSMVFLLSAVGRLEGPQRVSMIVLIFLLVLFFALVWDEVFGKALWILGKDPDLTGRTVFWGYLLQVISGNLPTLGYSYFAGFAVEVAPKIGAAYNLLLPEAHNGYLEVIIAFGYGGLAIAIGVLLWILLYSLRSVLMGPTSLSAFNALPLSLVMLIVGHNAVESTLIQANGPTAILLGWCAVMVAALGTGPRVKGRRQPSILVARPRSSSRTKFSLNSPTPPGRPPIQ